MKSNCCNSELVNFNSKYNQCFVCDKLYPKYNRMKELKIYEFQAKHILTTLDLVARLNKCEYKDTCFDRDVMQAKQMIENVIKEDINKPTSRI